MTLLVNYPIQIYIPKEHKDIVCRQLELAGVIFQKNKKISCVAQKQVSISTGTLINTLIKCQIKYVRVVAHDLKDPHFEDYLKNIEIIPHETNRFDFGSFVKDDFKVF